MTKELKDRLQKVLTDRIDEVHRQTSDGCAETLGTIAEAVKALAKLDQVETE